MMTARERRILELYGAALRLPAAERLSFVANEAAGDLALQRDVEQRLARDSATGVRVAGNHAGVEPGMQIGAYRIEALLGAGGMGVVYRAVDTRLLRAVAVKFLATELADPAARERFRREAQMASALNHPHILTVHDVGEYEGRAYLVTELVDGHTADEWANPPAPTPRPSWRQIVDMLTGVAEGLAAAHAANILHRDVKPANVLVSGAGHAKLADFGLAKLASDAPQAPMRDAQTRSGMIVGTVDYMSPEQVLGRSLDARSDVFSFGVLLYELLAGRRPFGGASELDRLQAIVDGALAPLSADIPEALRAIVEKALEKEPADRYQSMRDMAVDLRRAARRTSAPASNERAGAASRGRRPALIAVAAAVGIAIVGGVSIWYRSTSTALSIGQLVSLRPVTTYAGFEVSPSFAPDGERVTFSWGGESGTNSDIYVAQLGTTTLQRLTTDPAQDSFPRWAPDGNQIAFFRRRNAAGGDLMVIPALGGQERKVAEIGYGTPEGAAGKSIIAWTPDSRSLVFAANTAQSYVYRLYIVSLASGRAVPLGIDGGAVLGDLTPLVSADGRWLAFTRFLSGPTVGQVMAQRLRLATDGALALDGEPIAITKPGPTPQAVAWSPLSQSLVIVDGRMVREWPVRAGRALQVVYAASGPLESATVVWKDGRARVVASLLNADYDLFRVAIDPETHRVAGAAERRASSTLTDNQPQVSPDGAKISFTSARTGSVELWIADANGENPQQLTRLGAFLIGYQSWSRDGKRILFHARVAGQLDGGPRLYYVDVDGTGVAHPIDDGRLGLSVPSWSADGEYVYAFTLVDGRSRIHRVRVADGEVEPLFDGDVARVSNDGERILYVKVGQPGIFTRSLAGDVSTNAESLVISDYRPLDAWHVAADGIYYIATSDSNVRRLRFRNAATGETTDVFDSAPPIESFGFSPDGKQLWYAGLQGTAGSDLTLFEFEDPSAHRR